MCPLTIAIDASRITAAKRTGTENYALQLIRALLELDNKHQFWLYFRDTPPSNLLPANPRAKYRVIPWQRMWTHMRFSWTLWRDRPDVTFVPAHVLPLSFPGPAVVTVHDLGYIYFPNAHPGFARRYLEWSTRHSAEKATRIIADSLATARDLSAHYSISPNKISLVYPGVNEELNRVEDPVQLAAMRSRYGLPERYLLFVGTLQPRKNIARMVEAYARWRAKPAAPEVALVLAGPEGWLYDPAWTQGIKGIVRPGYVADEDLAALYSAAEALLFPSLHEGFGFPVLEAMRCGTPVITSNTSSLPEVAGDAALLVNARDVDAIASAIDQLLNDAALRQELITKGYEQARRFTWKRAAEGALHALEMAAQKH